MMNFAFSNTRASLGMNALPVSAEVHLANGLPKFTIVGLAETAVKESKDRVQAAIINSHYDFPCRRITVSLAPANLPKMGSGFDLPIAIGILAATHQIPKTHLETHEFIGELALSGAIREVKAIIPVVLAAFRDKQQLIIPAGNAIEASLAAQDNVFFAHTLREVCEYLSQGKSLYSLPPRPEPKAEDNQIDWSDVKGQYHAKQALEIAAVGGHSVLLSGPPGSGKTMLARRFSTVLPELTETQALECAAITSLRGSAPDFKAWRTPPFRSPHHTASPLALVGGGNPPKPGEISLAHHGVLFLDELPEFNRNVLETLREPLESGTICISRAAIQMEFPAQFQLIAAMNPCPCGQWGNPEANCMCTPDRINRYLAKLSAPLLDRIDMHIQVRALSQEELIKTNPNAPNQSQDIRDKVKILRALQIDRQGSTNATLNAKECERVAKLGTEEQAYLNQILNRLKMSARGYHRLLKVSRTIADMNQEDGVTVRALQQALSFKHIVQAPK